MSTAKKSAAKRRPAPADLTPAPALTSTEAVAMSIGLSVTDEPPPAAALVPTQVLVADGVAVERALDGVVTISRPNPAYAEPWGHRLAPPARLTVAVFTPDEWANIVAALPVFT